MLSIAHPQRTVVAVATLLSGLTLAASVSAVPHGTSKSGSVVAAGKPQPTPFPGCAGGC